jgi:hypothetical protein
LIVRLGGALVAVDACKSLPLLALPSPPHASLQSHPLVTLPSVRPTSPHTHLTIPSIPDPLEPNPTNPRIRSPTIKAFFRTFIGCLIGTTPPNPPILPSLTTPHKRNPHIPLRNPPHIPPPPHPHPTTHIQIQILTDPALDTLFVPDETVLSLLALHLAPLSLPLTHTHTLTRKFTPPPHNPQRRHLRPPLDRTKRPRRYGRRIQLTRSSPPSPLPPSHCRLMGKKKCSDTRLQPDIHNDDHPRRMVRQVRRCGRCEWVGWGWGGGGGGVGGGLEGV